MILRKIILMALSLPFIFSLLFGCQQKEKVSTESEWISVSISKTKGVDAITFVDPETNNALQSIFANAVKEPGIVNVTDPEFFLEVIDDRENHHFFYLWIGEEGQRSSLMNTEDTHTIYTVSEKETDQLIELVGSHFN